MEIATKPIVTALPVERLREYLVKRRSKLDIPPSVKRRFNIWKA